MAKELSKAGSRGIADMEHAFLENGLFQSLSRQRRIKRIFSAGFFHERQPPSQEGSRDQKRSSAQRARKVLADIASPRAMRPSSSSSSKPALRSRGVTWAEYPMNLL